MDSRAHDELKPLTTFRKAPRQARSGATVEAIFEATIQLLLESGVKALTTTRVAARAGVSVGTIYQYFNDRRALMLGLFERHIATTAGNIERACEAARGQTRIAVADALTEAFLQTILSRPQECRVAYIIAVEMDGMRLLPKMTRPVAVAVTNVLASTKEGEFADVADVGFAVTAVLGGAARALLEHDLESNLLQAQRRQLTLMMRGYLLLASRQGDGSSELPGKT